MIRRTLVALSAAGVLACTGIAGAHFETYRTVLTIKFSGSTSGDKFSGRVSSPKPPCEKRKVTVYRVGGTRGAMTAVGSDRTDAKGRWAVDPGGSVRPGKYLAATAGKRLVKSAAHKHRCAKVMTGTVQVGG